MAKRKSKKEDKSNFNLNGMVSDLMKTFALGAVRKQAMKLVDDALDSIHDTLVNFTKILGKLILSGVIFLFGITFLIISLVFLTQEYFDLSTGWSLFLWAFILMLFSLIYGAIVVNKQERN